MRNARRAITASEDGAVGPGTRELSTLSPARYHPDSEPHNSKSRSTKNQAKRSRQILHRRQPFTAILQLTHAANICAGQDRILTPEKDMELTLIPRVPKGATPQAGKTVYFLDCDSGLFHNIGPCHQLYEKGRSVIAVLKSPLIFSCEMAPVSGCAQACGQSFRLAPICHLEGSADD